MKVLLEQKVETEYQHKWVAKLMGYYITFEYKEGKENELVDELSRNRWKAGSNISFDFFSYFFMDRGEE